MLIPMVVMFLMFATFFLGLLVGRFMERSTPTPAAPPPPPTTPPPPPTTLPPTPLPPTAPVPTAHRPLTQTARHEVLVSPRDDNDEGADDDHRILWVCKDSKVYHTNASCRFLTVTSKRMRECKSCFRSR